MLKRKLVILAIVPLLLVLGCEQGKKPVTPPKDDKKSESKATTPAKGGGGKKGVHALSDEEFAKAKHIYFDTCAGCHGTLRKGATGPALEPAKVRKLGQDYIKKIMTKGTAKGMPGWGDQGVLDQAQIDLVAKYLTNEAPQPPMMSRAQMEKSWKVTVPVDKRPTKPAHNLNWRNFMGVILRDAGKVAIIDGDTKKKVAIVDTGFAVHILRSSASGRYFYSIGRDGKVNLIDLWMSPPQTVAVVKVGIDARSIDVSKYKGEQGDFSDKFAIVGCYWPPQLVVLDGLTLKPRQILSTSGYTYDTDEHLVETRVAAIVASHHDPSWIACMKETGYVWMIDYSDVDNLKVTHIKAERFLHDGGWDSTKRYFLVAANARNTVCVIDAKEQKLVKRIKVGIKPHPGRGANFVTKEWGPVWATGHLGSPDVALIGSDPKGHPQHAWKEVKRLKLLSGGNLFIKTHPKSKHLWADHALNPDATISRTVVVYDLNDLSKAPKKLLVGTHGRAVHMEYNAAGDEVWVSLWDQEGELVIYDDKTLKEKARIKGAWLRTPTGKFNVENTAKDIY